MIKDNPLYKEHKDMFKKRFGLAYLIRKHISYTEDATFLLILFSFFTFPMLSGIFFKIQQFWLGASTIAIFMAMASCYIYQIYYLKTYHKDISLEKRKSIIRSVVKHVENIKNQYDMNDDITRKTVESFISTQYSYFEDLLSDSDDNIKRAFNYFFNDGYEYIYNFENSIKKIDENIAQNKQQQVSIIAKDFEQKRIKQRLSEVLYPQKIETPNT